MHEDPPAPARTTAAPRTATRPVPVPATPAVAPRPRAGAAPGPAPASPDGPLSGHTTTTIERGSFCLARCTCGWVGPARRSRDRARTDAAEHLAAP
ncbi:hypothetical protein [Streptomyces sp. NPDC017448]|uniref:hypothetical protein n=1 Tax=Streptomyces sp. NPDC017448 TaxID=3364996 RepID=UPI00378F3A72